MIDTDKYKGHTPAPWKALFNHPQVDGSCVVSDEDESNFGDTWYERIHGPLWVGELTDDMPDTKLIADAPLLLEEVKRLQRYEREHKELWDIIANFSPKDSEEDDDIYQQWLESVSQGYMGSVYEYVMMKQEEMIE